MAVTFPYFFVGRVFYMLVNNYALFLSNSEKEEKGKMHSTKDIGLKDTANRYAQYTYERVKLLSHKVINLWL